MLQKQTHPAAFFNSPNTSYYSSLYLRMGMLTRDCDSGYMLESRHSPIYWHWLVLVWEFTSPSTPNRRFVSYNCGILNYLRKLTNLVFSSPLVMVIPSLASSLSELSSFNQSEASFIIICIRSIIDVPYG